MISIEEKAVYYLMDKSKEEIDRILNISDSTYKTKDDCLYDLAHNYWTQKYPPKLIFLLAQKYDWTKNNRI